MPPTSVDIAEAALELIEVEYEALPAVFTAEEAMRPGMPVLHPEKVEIGSGAVAGHHAELRMYPPIPNVISHLTLRQGYAAGALADAHRVFEHSFTVPSVHQGYIEPHSCVVSVGANGVVDIWAANKGPHIARVQMAVAIGVPENRLRFNPVYIGGDFGGKGSLMDTILCYYLALAARRPVKMVMTSFEELTAGNPRHSATITLRTGLDQDAKIQAIDARIVFNAGAYAGFIPGPTLHGYSELAGTYRVPNCTIEVLRAYTNTVPRGHMRSPGAPQVTFAVESHIDMIAHELGLDPLEFRRHNAITDGDLTPLGDRRRHMRCRETIDEGARVFGWDKPRPPGVGRGVSIYEHPSGSSGRSTVLLTVDKDGRIMILLGAPDQGAGFHTMAAQLVAEHFGLSMAEVEVEQGDTLSTGFEFWRRRPAAHDDGRAGDCGRRRQDERGSHRARRRAPQLRAIGCPGGRGWIVFRLGDHHRHQVAHGLGRVSRQGTLQRQGGELGHSARSDGVRCAFCGSGSGPRNRAGAREAYRHRA